jgi:putative transposase
MCSVADPQPIRQAFRFALDVRPEQEALLLSFTGATRFFFNWGLDLVKQRLDERAAGDGGVSVPWSYKALCSEFAKVKHEVAPWRREVVCGSQQAGLEQLARALQSFSAGRRAGRWVGFPRLRAKGRARQVVIFQRARALDARHVQLDRRLGPVRSKERLTKLVRLLATDPRARIVRATVVRGARSWFISFQVERSPKQRSVRRPQAAVGVDLGLRRRATLSTGATLENLRPLEAALRRLRRMQRRLERQRRAANPGNYLPDGRVRPGSKQWLSSRRMARTRERIRRLHERAANLRREQAHELTSLLTREFGVIGVESLNVAGMLRGRRLARQISDAGFGLILAQLAYKVSWSGSLLVAAERFYPSSKTCSQCGRVKAKLGHGEEVFSCADCGLVIDRDLNAALNLAALVARRAQAEGCEQCYVARTGRETLNARGGQVSPGLGSGHSPGKREGSASAESARRREAPALASAYAH